MQKNNYLALGALIGIFLIVFPEPATTLTGLVILAGIFGLMITG